MNNEIQKYQGGLIQLLFQNQGNVVANQNDILSLECVVAGTTFIKNINKIDQTLEEGQVLDLKREADNIYDSLAIAIYTIEGSKIGYIPRDRNETLARLMDGAKWFYARVEEKERKGGWLKIDIQVYLKD
jgi:hypothetical protein